MSTGRAWVGRAAVVAVWVLAVLEVVMMTGAGLAKFVNADWWTQAFVGWGYPAWFSPVVGGAEVALAVALLIPELTAWAGLALAGIMVAALGTVLVHPGALGPGAPLVHLALLAVLVAARWRRRLGRPPTTTSAPAAA